jgi:hypothetical protein
VLLKFLRDLQLSYRLQKFARLIIFRNRMGKDAEVQGQGLLARTIPWKPPENRTCNSHSPGKVNAYERVTMIGK